MTSISIKATVAGLVLMAGLVPTQVFAWVTKDPALLNKGPIAPPSFVHPRPLVQPRPFVHRPFYGGSVIYSAPPVYYYAPSYPPPAYYDPPTSYVPPSTYYPSSAYAAPSGGTATVTATPGVVEYPHGRYELHGDGVAAPYTWVWIPKPPTSAPPETIPAPPAPTAPPESAPSKGTSESRPSGPLYRWTDEQGAVNWTDRFDAIPERYRGSAKQIQPS